MSCCCGGHTNTCCGSVTVPNTLHATFSGGTGTCTCLNGVTVVLTWTGAIWQGGFNPCGFTGPSMSLDCNTGAWLIGFAVTCNMGTTTLRAGWVCGPPISLVFDMAVPPGPGQCCNGTVVITITP